MALWFKGLESGKACFTERGSGSVISGSCLGDEQRGRDVGDGTGSQRAAVFCQSFKSKMAG